MASSIGNFSRSSSFDNVPGAIIEEHQQRIKADRFTIPNISHREAL
jgi:hypothetical protein